jgi:integrase
MDFVQIRALLTEHFRQRLIKAKAEIGASGRLGVIKKQSLGDTAHFASEALLEGEPLFPGAPDDEWMSRLIAQYELDVQPGTQAYENLRTETIRAHRDYCNALLDYDSALDRYDFATAPSTGLPTNDRRATNTVSISLRALVSRFAAERNLGNAWVPKTQTERADHLALLSEILGEDTDVLTITAADAQRVKDTLMRYPKNRRKNPLTRDLTLSQILQLQDVERLTVRTMNNYLQTYAPMFDWAKRNGFVTENHFDGINIKQGRSRGKLGRKAFNETQVQLLLTELVENKSGLVRLQYQKWGPLIALYSGARLNEIAQLHLKDIHQEEGIWCFDLNDDDDTKKLKTDASARVVPIHSQLIGLGLLDYVQELRQSGAKKLFPGFQYCSKNGWGRSLGRWFNDQFLVKIGMKNKGVSFHVFRHTVVTKLLQTGVEEALVRTLVGHERQGVTQKHYFGSGYKISQLRDALEKLRYEDMSANVRSFQ